MILILIFRRPKITAAYGKITLRSEVRNVSSTIQPVQQLYTANFDSVPALLIQSARHKRGGSRYKIKPRHLDHPKGKDQTIESYKLIRRI